MSGGTVLSLVFYFIAVFGAASEHWAFLAIGALAVVARSLDEITSDVRKIREKLYGQDKKQ